MGDAGLMGHGEGLTRLTVWAAVAAYAAASAGMLTSDTERRPAWIRWVWTGGCGFFLAHVACAFGFYHGWSHEDAYRVTAEQTAAMTGIAWGGGLFLNYLFGIVWLADVLCRWIAPESVAHRPRPLSAMLHGFLFFMVFNGAVVFVPGPQKWLGVLLCGGLAALGIRRLVLAVRDRRIRTREEPRMDTDAHG